MPMTKDTRALVPDCNRSAEHLPLLGAYDAYESLHMLTMLSTP
jgi:hypothetical protein